MSAVGNARDIDDAVERHSEYVDTQRGAAVQFASGSVTHRCPKSPNCSRSVSPRCRTSRTSCGTPWGRRWEPTPARERSAPCSIADDDDRARDYDLVVLGGGAAGLTAARGSTPPRRRNPARQRRPARRRCTFTGCVPSKALLAAAARGLQFDDAMNSRARRDRNNRRTGRMRNRYAPKASTSSKAAAPSVQPR